MYTTLTLKIFIGLQEIAGYFGSLNEGFKELNVDSTFINLRQHPFQYKGGDTPNFLIKAAKAIGYRIPATTKNLLQMPYRSLISAMFFLGLEQFMKIILFI